MKTKNIKELGLSLDDLYESKRQIGIHLSDKPYIFTLCLQDYSGNIDCKISSFAANMWARTRKGMEYKKYSRIQDLQRAVNRLVKSKIDTDGELSYSLSEDVILV